MQCRYGDAEMGVQGCGVCMRAQRWGAEMQYKYRDAEIGVQG